MPFGEKKFFDQRVQEFKITLMKIIDKMAQDKGIMIDEFSVTPDEKEVAEINETTKKMETKMRLTGKVVIQIILAKSKKDIERERAEGYTSENELRPS